MECHYTSREISEYTAKQLNTFFPDRNVITADGMYNSVVQALDRVEFCFKHIAWPTYSANGTAKFDLLHSDQYCTYLYFLSNSIFRREGDLNAATKLFYLNKALHGLNCMYDTQLPDIFWLGHAVGAVLGKAQYSNYMMICQNCTIGALRGEYPVLGPKLNLSAGASIIGGCTIGENVIIAPGVTVLKQQIPANTLVTQSGALTFKSISEQGVRSIFNLDI